MIITRTGANRIQELLHFFPSVAVVGARQTGKTTLVQSQFPDYTYVSLDVPSEAEAAENDPDSFFARHPGGWGLSVWRD